MNQQREDAKSPEETFEETNEEEKPGQEETNVSLKDQLLKLFTQDVLKTLKCLSTVHRHGFLNKLLNMYCMYCGGAKSVNVSCPCRG